MKNHSNIADDIDPADSDNRMLSDSKALEVKMIKFVKEVGEEKGIDPWTLSMAHANLLQGFMWLNRSIAKTRTRIY